MAEKISDQETAYHLVELYVREVSQRGEKRQMGLDTIINAYFYTLTRLQRKSKEMGVFEDAAEKEEAQLGDAEDLFLPGAGSGEDQFDFK